MPFSMPRDMHGGWSPLHFLAALGAGGLVVTFFLWLMFWVPHPNATVPVFEDIMAAFRSGGVATRAMIAGAWAGIAFFALMHIRLLVWNIGQYRAFRYTDAYRALRSGNAETQLLALPLTLAMTVNAGFILGLVFIPNLWSVVEYLFPLALLAFLALGAWSFSLLGDFFGRVLTGGGFDCAKNNSFAQLLPGFALGMISVGLSAPSAMSAGKLTVGVSIIAATFFMVASVILVSVQLVLGFRSMLENGVDDQAAPTLWIAIPIVTVLSIAMLRMDHGLHAAFGAGTGTPLVTLAQLLSIQILFGLVGWTVLRRTGYLTRHVRGDAVSPGAWALVCPGVALGVMVQFFINKALVPAGLVAKFGPAYWSLTAIAIALQIVTIWLVLKLAAKHFGGQTAATAVPAE